MHGSTETMLDMPDIATFIPKGLRSHQKSLLRVYKKLLPPLRTTGGSA